MSTTIYAAVSTPAHSREGREGKNSKLVLALTPVSTATRSQIGMPMQEDMKSARLAPCKKPLLQCVCVCVWGGKSCYRLRLRSLLVSGAWGERSTQDKLASWSSRYSDKRALLFVRLGPPTAPHSRVCVCVFVCVCVCVCVCVFDVYLTICRVRNVGVCDAARATCSLLQDQSSTSHSLCDGNKSRPSVHSHSCS